MNPKHLDPIPRPHRTGRLLWVLTLVFALGPGPARAETGDDADGAYLPLFVMYSGNPAPQQLQALRQFLATNEVPGEVIRDTLETVVYKLNTFRAGFAYPVFRDDVSTSGHACVVADNRHDDPANGWTLLASERVYRPLLLGRIEKIDAAQLLDNVFAHELFHCYDIVRHSLEQIGQQVLRHGPKYFAYWGEAGADAYAALQHLRQGGGKELLRTVRDFRTLNLLNGDAVHYTAGVLDHVLWHHSPDTLRGMSTRQLIALADRVREEAALSPQDFAAMQGAAAAMNREYETLLGDYPGLGKAHGGELMRPDGYAVSREYQAALFARVRTALWHLGGKAAVESPWFAPLGARFDLAPAHVARAP